MYVLAAIKVKGIPIHIINIIAAIIALERISGDLGVLDKGTTRNCITAHIKIPYKIPDSILLFVKKEILGKIQNKKIVKANAIQK